MAVIQKHRHGLSRPSSDQYQVNGMVSINISSLDYQPASRRSELNKLSPNGAESQLNAVISAVGLAAASFYAGQIWVKVAIKIGNGKL